MELTESTAKQELPACPVETTLTLISDKWKVLILRDLMNGTLRFGELKKSIGHVTQKVLTAQLRQMEASGLLTRKVYAEVPPRVEYTRTRVQPETRDGRPVEMGRKLSGTVPLIRLSIRKNNFQEENHASYFNDRHRRHDCML